MKSTLLLVTAILILVACLDTPRSDVNDLCGDPPTIAGIATFLTVIQDQPYVCATAESDHQRALEVSLTRQWEQCMTEARMSEGSLATALITARRDRNASQAAVSSWIRLANKRGELALPKQAPGWKAYERAEEVWKKAVADVDDWMTRDKESQ